MSDLNDDRFHDVLKLIGDQRSDFQAFETRLLQAQAEHWKSVTIAIRTLSNWWAENADREARDRKVRQDALDERLTLIEANQRILVRLGVVAGLLALGVVVGWLVL